MNDDVTTRLQLARELCVAAGKRTLKWFQASGLSVEKKGDSTPVTAADRDAEQYLRQQIGEHFPDDGIVGEEFGVTEGKNSVRWILDPIDGTKSFISGVPLYGTMVGVEINGQPDIGVIYFPGLDEGAFASTGNGAWHFQGDHQPVRCQVSTCRQLSDAVMVVSEEKTFTEKHAGSAYQQLVDGTYFVRTWGDCYGYLLVATGRVELMIDPVLSIWDAAAVAPIVRESGGLFVDWAGVPGIDAGEAIGCCPEIVDDVLKITRPFAGNPLS